MLKAKQSANTGDVGCEHGCLDRAGTKRDACTWSHLPSQACSLALEFACPIHGVRDTVAWRLQELELVLPETDLQLQPCALREAQCAAGLAGRLHRTAVASAAMSGLLRPV